MSQGRQEEIWAGITLTWCNRAGRAALKIGGWAGTEPGQQVGPDPGEFSRRFTLLTTEALESGRDVSLVPSVAGRFEIAGDALYFIPRFPFVAGAWYSLVARPAPAGEPDSAPTAFRIQYPAADAQPSAVVSAIYPDVASVPVNLLKFYVQFSQPMSEGRAQRAIRVCRDDTGELLEGVFVPMDPELWDPARQRMTLLLDPARIKHGLVPNMEVGYPLLEGVPFRLCIEPAFRDAKGRPLLTGTERRYQVGPEVRERIDPRKWQLTVPAPGSLDSLLVDFERPLDYALLQRCLWVNGPLGASVPGHGRSGRGEGCWSFTPTEPWVEGCHQLVVDRRLEDLAGNSPVRIFDRDMTEPDDGPPPTDNVVVGFLCRNA